MTKQEKPRTAERRKPAPSQNNRRAKEKVGGGGPRRDSDGGSPKAHRPAQGNPAPTMATVGAKISRRASDRIRSGHVWVYASDVESIAATATDGSEAVPSLLP